MARQAGSQVVGNQVVGNQVVGNQVVGNQVVGNIGMHYAAYRLSPHAAEPMLTMAANETGSARWRRCALVALISLPQKFSAPARLRLCYPVALSPRQARTKMCAGAASNAVAA